MTTYGRHSQHVTRGIRSRLWVMPRPSPPSYTDNIQCYPSGSNYPVSDVLDWPGYTNNCIKKEKCGSTLTLKEVVVMVAKQFGNFYSNAKRGQITQADTTYRGWDLLNDRIKRDSIWLMGIEICSISTKTQTYGPSEDIVCVPIFEIHVHIQISSIRC